jgi:ABC-type branched-subunit amino acid transport system substrate-binding protein
VRVGLILPLTATGNGGIVGNALKNSAEMAVAEFNGSAVQLLVQDDRGTAEGGREAAQKVLADGAEIIIGPLFAPSVQAVGQAARAAGKPVIAFSTDASVASKGVYLLSFMPESDVDTVLELAAARGKRSIAAMIPNNAYGSVVAGAFQEIAARRNLRVVTLERYSPDKASIDAAVKKIASLDGQADALFLPDNGDGMPAVGQALLANGVDNRKLQMLGTGVWDDPRVLGVKAIQGGWFSAPDKAGYNNFAARYRARYGTEPVRIATLSYDAVFLVNALYTKYGSSGFSEATLTSADGIIGTDGLFRFRPDGTNQRGLAVLQVGNGGAQTISPAPRTFPAGT